MPCDSSVMMEFLFDKKTNATKSADNNGNAKSAAGCDDLKKRTNIGKEFEV